MTPARLSMLAIAIALNGWIASCGGGDEAGAVDLGSGLTMTADGHIVDRNPLPDFAFASAADWKRYALEAELQPRR